MLEDPLLTKPRKSLVKPRYFMCDSCDKGFTTRKRLKIHTAKNICKRVKDKPKSQAKQWSCQICDAIFSSSQDKLKHCNEEHIGNQVKCNEKECNCNKLFKTRQGLQRHMKRGTFVCKFCKATFSTKEEKGEHCKNVHIYQYSCKQDVCGELFISWADLVAHASQEHKYTVRKRWRCKFCDKSFSRNNVRRKHIKLIHIGKVFKCNDCSMQYQEQESLESHLNLIHNKKRWPCKFCDKYFSRNAVRRKHTKLIHEGKLFKCNECLMKYQEKESLESHNLKYHKLTYPCIACNFVGESREEIRFHKKKHVEDCHTIEEKTPECGESDYFENEVKIELEQGEIKMRQKSEEELPMISNEIEDTDKKFKTNPVLIPEYVMHEEELPMFKNEIEDTDKKSKTNPVLIPEQLIHEYEEKRKELENYRTIVL